MGYNNDVSIRPIHFDNVDRIIDEKGSTFIALRLTQWCKEGQEPDKTKAKYELRKWRVGAEGERADKGVSFLTEEGLHEVPKAFIQEGFGHTKELLVELKKRDDFVESVNHLFDKEDESSGEYFDIRNILLSETVKEEDIEDDE